MRRCPNARAHRPPPGPGADSKSSVRGSGTPEVEAEGGGSWAAILLAVAVNCIGREPKADCHLDNLLSDASYIVVPLRGQIECSGKLSELAARKRSVLNEFVSCVACLDGLQTRNQIAEVWRRVRRRGGATRHRLAGQNEASPPSHNVGNLLVRQMLGGLGEMLQESGE